MPKLTAEFTPPAVHRCEMDRALGARCKHMSLQLPWSRAQTQLLQQQVRPGFLKPQVSQKPLIGCSVRVRKHLEDNQNTSNKQHWFIKNKSCQAKPIAFFFFFFFLFGSNYKISG